MPIDQKSVASHHLVLYSNSQAISSGTGFFVKVDNINLLITNYHVLSGRNPTTGEQLPNCNTIPNRILIPVLYKSSELQWYPIIQEIYSMYGESRWVEHPKYKREFDVVALPIYIPDKCYILPYPLDPGPEVTLHMGSDVAIIGFPEGMSASGITAIWKSGSIASEPQLNINEEEFFYIDANTRSGMSGSPVIARRFGTALMENGNVEVRGIVDRTIGVYAGRSLDTPDMTLGRVWKWKGVIEVIEHSVSMCQRGIIKPNPCFLS